MKKEEKRKNLHFVAEKKKDKELNFVSILDIGYLFSLKFVQHGR
jgi:hypothetical protein